MDRLTIAAVHLDKEMVPWFQMMQRNQPFQSWQAFARALEVDFGPFIYDCPRATLFKLVQIGTVNDYYIELTSLANIVYGLSNDALLDYFLSGLKDELRREVMARSPLSLLKAVALAKLFEEKYSPSYKPNLSAKYQNTNTHPKNRFTNSSTHHQTSEPKTIYHPYYPPHPPNNEPDPKTLQY